jgi:hypothetical protein
MCWGHRKESYTSSPSTSQLSRCASRSVQLLNVPCSQTAAVNTWMWQYVTVAREKWVLWADWHRPGARGQYDSRAVRCLALCPTWHFLSWPECSSSLISAGGFLKINCTEIMFLICYKPEGRGFESRWGGIFHYSSRTMALGSTQPLTEMSTRNLSGG